MIEKDQYRGCFIGLALGDAFGAPFEGGILERRLWSLLSKTKDGFVRYTDDTQMSIDVAQSFLTNGAIDPDHLATTFSNSYRWSRGYGPGTAWLLKKIKNGAHWKDVNQAKFEGGSFGNGAAMRAPIVALCSPEDRTQLTENIIKSSEVTHAHPLAIEGARLIAETTCCALKSHSIEDTINYLSKNCTFDEFAKKLKLCADYLLSDVPPEQSKIKKYLGNKMAATDSCITAIFFALKYRDNDFDEMHSKICKLGGDADTIAAMAGAIWGAFNGVDSLNSASMKKLESGDFISSLTDRLYDLVIHKKA